MTYAQRDDVVEGKSTAANYDRWHESIDELTLETKFKEGEGRTIAEILGDTDGDQ